VGSRGGSSISAAATRVAQAVSYARATISAIWRKEQESAGAAPLDYSQERIEAAERGIAFQQAVWERMFNDLRIDPLAIWHEDVLADPDAAAQQAAAYIGAAIDPAAAVQIPLIRKQSRGDAREWMERYARSRRPE
jgi:trehalose 2-sulfotransferase